MSDMPWEMLAELIRTHALENFRDLSSDSGMESPTARFYKIPDQDRPQAVVKVFSTSDAENFYWQELSALHILRQTERVAPVIGDATRDHPHFWQRDFKRPFFIAKPYYSQTLDSILATATSVERLDLAAQRVAIARSFWDVGWRDYDWHPSNDVVDINGRVLRIDLDSALSKRPLPIKSRLREPDYFSRAERSALDALIKDRDRSFDRAEPLETSNMVIRLCSFFFDLNDQTELTTQLDALQPSTHTENSFPGAAPTIDLVAQGQSKPDHPGTRIDALIRKVLTFFFLNPGKKEEVGTKEDSRLPGSTPPMEPWLHLWRRQSQTDVQKTTTFGPTFQQLTSAESELLARLFFHLIVVQDHGFSLRDLYGSLLMLEAGVLRDRCRQFDTNKQYQARQIAELAPTVKFYQFLTAFSEDQQRDAKQEKQAHQTEIQISKPIVDTPSSDFLKAMIVSGGNAWPAAGKAACEDRSLVISAATNWFLLVTDGASDASGYDAAAIVVAEFSAWCKDRLLHSPEEANRELRSIFTKINSKLFEAAKLSSRAHQAMVVAAVVGVRDRDCFIAYAQAGDSQCVILEPDGSIRSWTRNLDTVRLGQNDPLSEGAVGIGFSVLDAEAAGRGKYRVRLYSDGVGTNGVARIRAVPDIEALVNEAASWDRDLTMAVGQDDWAIAGLDIQVDRAERPSDLIRAETETPIPRNPSADPHVQIDSDDEVVRLKRALDVVDCKRLGLSASCATFWQQVLVEMTDQAGSIEVLREWFEVKTRKAESFEANIEKSSSSPTYLPDHASHVFWSSWAVKLKAVIIAAVILGAVSGFFWTYYLRDSGRKDEVKAVDPQTQVEVKEPKLEFVTEESKLIYERLREGKPYSKERLPGRDSIQSIEIQEFLRELASVLNATRYPVLIEVYGDRTGTEKANLLVTSIRAEAISRSLTTQLRVSANQIKTNGRGLMDDSTVSMLESQMNRSIDRSGAIIVVKRLRQ